MNSEIDWELLKIFVTCSNYKSFTEAAKETGLTPQTLRSQMRKLEDQIGKRILIRKKKNLSTSLNFEGKILRKKIAFFDSLLTGAVDLLTCADNNKTKERINIYTTQGLAFSWLPAQLQYFWQKFPDIEVSVKISQKPKKLSFGDIQIRREFYPQDHLQKVQILSFEQALFASQEYIKKHGNPVSIAELKGHKFLFPFKNIKSENPLLEQMYLDTKLISEDFVLALSLCQMGEGILSVPAPLFETKSLVRVLKNEKFFKNEVYAGYVEDSNTENNPASKFFECILQRNELLEAPLQTIKHIKKKNT
tara:strand:+ start:569 stop:1486 length:918 start_codon:yes stop_codon:yes gene_type:complete